jgi:hypothetical protein
MGEELRIVILRNNKYLDQITIPSSSNYDNYKLQFFEGGSGNDNFIPTNRGADKILVFRPEEVKGRKLKQIFRENDKNNCVFVPMIKAVQKVLEEDLSKPTRIKYIRMLDQITIESEKFESGVPEEEIIPLSQRLGMRIELTDVLGQTMIENGSKNAKVNVKISNTKKNHVDYYTDDSIVEISQKEMNEKYEELRKTNQFYIVYNNTDVITTLKTLNGTYKVINKDKSHFEYMNQQIRSSSIDAIKYPDLNEFIKTGRLVNSAFVSFQPFNENVICWDMKNAYAKYQECKYYEGFPYILHQYRNTDKIQGLGIYEFSVIKSTPHSKLFGLYADNKYILPSVEIKWWIDNGLKLEITRGVWGSSLKLDMTKEFFK